MSGLLECAACVHRLPPESEGDGYRMQHALAAALGRADQHPDRQDGCRREDNAWGL